MVNHPNRKRSLSERIAGLTAVKQERDALREESALYRMEADTLRAEVARLTAQNATMRTALTDIANEDYRGNRPWSATRAFAALEAR